MSASSTSQVAKKAAAAAVTSATGVGSSSKMKLLAIPLARARPGAQPIVTYVAHRPKVADASSSSSSGSADATAAEAKPSIATRLLNKASDFWIGLGKPGVKSTFDWKRRTYNGGEKLMDRIEYQEWSLKGIDPALGPSIRHPTGQEGKEGGSEDGNGKVEGQAKIGSKDMSDVPLLYASSSTSTANFTTSPSVLLSSLTNLIQHRTPHHRQRLIYCIVGMPFTIPFALIPVIPNLPFFYLCWRAFSHWKAYKASDYLGLLLQQGRILPTKSAELEEIINTPAPPPGAAKAIENGKEGADGSTSSSSAPQDATAAKEEPEPEDSRIILKPHHIELLLSRFHLDRQCAQDLRRAREQTLSQLQQASSAAVAADAGQSGDASAGSTPAGISNAAKRTMEELEKTAELGERDRASEKTG